MAKIQSAARECGNRAALFLGWLLCPTTAKIILSRKPGKEKQSENREVFIICLYVVDILQKIVCFTKRQIKKCGSRWGKPLKAAWLTRS
ncbi:MAG: hypothetical protein J5899_03435 [Acidaminococcaceae bacterium]|nr:hypothetical protein [Acidaminococcaceae bacterium]